MTGIYSMAIDVIAVFIVLFSVYRAYKLGFLRSMVLLIGYVLSIFAAFYFSNLITNLLYDNVIRAQVIKSVDETILGMAEISNIATTVPAILAMLPNFLSRAISTSLGGNEAIIAMLEEKTSGIIDNISIVVSDFIVKPIVYALLQTLLCLIIFIICVIIVKTIAKIFKGFYVIPILGTVNSLLGGVLGIIQSGVFLLLLGLVSSAVIAIIGNSCSWFNNDILNSTYIFKYFYLRF